MKHSRIRFATDILRRLGEELNPSPDKGILELVKNAYDADARSCVIELSETDETGGYVQVTDDGNGMTGSDIEAGWLVLGKSMKSSRHQTPLGRIPAGSKGLGRLAALRMGSTAILTSWPRKEKEHQYSLQIDWDDYKNVGLVEDVTLTIKKSDRPQLQGNGSQILIKNLCVRVGRMDVKRLARELILLADPFGADPTGFKPTLNAPEFSDLEKLVRTRYFEDADYHLVAHLNEKGLAEASVVDWRGNKLFSAGHDQLAQSRSKSPYKCPAAEFDLWAFLLNKATFSGRSVTLEEVRAWLHECGGVHLYYNGLRVPPYGNPGNDWLEMNLRRSQSPEERPSTNTSIGRLKVVDTANHLVQKTDRSGFVESEAFRELVAFATDAMEWMAKRRLAIAEQRRAKERIEASTLASESKKTLEDAIGDAPRSTQVKLKKALRRYDRSRDRETERLRREVQLYRTLSTAGITAATFAHESNSNPIKVITQSIKAIERRAKEKLRKHYDKLLRQPVEGIIRATEGLAVLGAVILKLVDHEKRRVSRVDLHDVIKDVLKTYEPFLSGRDVHMESNLFKGSPYLRGSEAAVESIITNLINNSLAAFERAGTLKRRIQIHTKVEDSIVTLRIFDNGPGIEGISKEDIWLPGYTTQKNGTGLGLTIVRDAVKDLGGDVDAIEHGALGGAEIIIEIPVLGV